MDGDPPKKITLKNAGLAEIRLVLCDTFLRRRHVATDIFTRNGAKNLILVRQISSPHRRWVGVRKESRFDNGRRHTHTTTIIATNTHSGASSPREDLSFVGAKQYGGDGEFETFTTPHPWNVGWTGLSLRVPNALAE